MALLYVVFYVCQAILLVLDAWRWVKKKWLSRSPRTDRSNAMKIQTLGWIMFLVVFWGVFVGVSAAIIVAVLRLTAMFIIAVDNNYPALQVLAVIAAIIFAVWTRKRWLAERSIGDESENKAKTQAVKVTCPTCGTPFIKVWEPEKEDQSIEALERHIRGAAANHETPSPRSAVNDQ